MSPLGYYVTPGEPFYLKAHNNHYRFESWTYDKSEAALFTRDQSELWLAERLPCGETRRQAGYRFEPKEDQ